MEPAEVDEPLSSLLSCRDLEATRAISKHNATREDPLLRAPGSGALAGPKSEMATLSPSGWRKLFQLPQRRCVGGDSGFGVPVSPDEFDRFRHGAVPALTD